MLISRVDFTFNVRPRALYLRLRLTFLLKIDDSDTVSSMSIYSNTIKSVIEIRTISAHLGALGKIMALTEDRQLYDLIQYLVFNLQYQMQHSVGRQIPISLMSFPSQQVVQLVEYCKYQKQGKKEEWQVLAERNGWSPPEKRNPPESASDAARRERFK